MDNFTIAVDADGIALVTFDVPGRSMNTISASVQRDLDTLAERIRSDNAIRGAILCSGKPSGFCAGADLGEMLDDIDRWRAAVDETALRAALDEASGLSRRVRALERCGKPIAAAIAGLALGGGLELALGCHFRVTVDDPKLRLAFPESGIGLLPGAGGTQRLLRLIGIDASIPHLLDGAPISLADALAGGVLHKAVPADALIETARAWILEQGNATAPWDEKGFKVPGGGPHSPLGYQRFGPAIAARHADAGDRYPAEGNILKALYEGAQVPIDAALRIESRYFLKTARSPQSKAMIRTFFTNRQALAKAESREDASACLTRLAAVAESEAQTLIDEGIAPAAVAQIAKSAGFSGRIAAGGGQRGGRLAMGDGALIEQRFLYAQGIEAARCLEDGAVRDPRELDAQAIAAGFPRWTGGPLSFIDMEGPARFIETAKSLEQRHGDRFALPAGLAARIGAGRAIYS